MTTTSLKIILTAYNMGPETTEADFDAWAAYVNEHVDAVVGETVQVEQFDFNAGQSKDRIEGATYEQRETLRRWLAVDGWEAFCASAKPVDDEGTVDMAAEQAAEEIRAGLTKASAD